MMTMWNALAEWFKCGIGKLQIRNVKSAIGNELWIVIGEKYGIMGKYE